MLLFNAIFVQSYKTGTSFQYIPYYYSTNTYAVPCISYHFNTFHVVIQYIEIMEEIDKTLFQCILCYYSTTSGALCTHFQSKISIHHMLLFNVYQNLSITVLKLISMHLMLLFNYKLKRLQMLVAFDFNTSHVVIQFFAII